jgi:hypothetical protein
LGHDDRAYQLAGVSVADHRMIAANKAAREAHLAEV